MKNKFCREILSLTFLAVLFMQAPAQQKALQIGDKIPEEIWTTALSMGFGSEKTTTLAKDRGKLILLDFWATWCSACLLSFPKMEALQEKFGDQIKIVGVTDQSRATIEQFFASKNGQRYRNMQSVIEDKTFSQLFPHKGIPFIIWIKDGKVLNTTDAEQVNAEAISAILKGGTGDLQTIVQLSRERPLMLSERFDTQKNVTLLNYSFMSKGYLPEIGGGGTFRKTTDGKIYGCQFTNLPLKDIFFSVGLHLFKERNISADFTEKRMIIDVAKPGEFYGYRKSDGTYDRKEMYSYELLVPQTKPETLYTNMLADLNVYSPYHAKIEKRNMECLIVKRLSKADYLKTKGGNFENTFPGNPAVLRNSPLEGMVNMINGGTELRLLMINETGYDGNVDLQISGINSVEQLNTELRQYGLHIIKEFRELEMLVITDARPLSPLIKN